MVNHPGYIVSPKSTLDIIECAYQVRKKLGLKPDDEVCMDAVLEKVEKIKKGSNFSIVEPDEMSEEGVVDFDGFELTLRSDVYDGCCDGNPRDRFTAAHEIGHLDMHVGSVGFARSSYGKERKAYECSEWQANTFAGVFLLPPELARKAGSPKVAAEKYKISLPAAECVFRHYARCGIKISG